MTSSILKDLDEITQTKKLHQRDNSSEKKNIILHVLAMASQILKNNLELILFATTFSQALRGLKSNENTGADYKFITSTPTHSLLQAFPVTN